MEIFNRINFGDNFYTDIKDIDFAFLPKLINFMIDEGVGYIFDYINTFLNSKLIEALCLYNHAILNSGFAIPNRIIAFNTPIMFVNQIDFAPNFVKYTLLLCDRRISRFDYCNSGSYANYNNILNVLNNFGKTFDFVPFYFADIE